MPWINVRIHFVWSTKCRIPFLNDKIRQSVFHHIKENARSKGIVVDMINGYHDHVHCLISLGSNQTIEKIMQLLKGESSHWINKHRLCEGHFGWQEEYFAASVSESNLSAVRAYIANQENHHRNSTFETEFKSFLKRAGFQRFDDDWDR